MTGFFEKLNPNISGSNHSFLGSLPPSLSTKKKEQEPNDSSPKIPSSGLETLPPEITLNILSYLSPIDLATLSETSTTLHKLAKDPISLIGRIKTIERSIAKIENRDLKEDEIEATIDAKIRSIFPKKVASLLGNDQFQKLTNQNYRKYLLDLKEKFPPYTPKNQNGSKEIESSFFQDIPGNYKRYREQKNRNLFLWIQKLKDAYRNYRTLPENVREDINNYIDGHYDREVGDEIRKEIPNNTTLENFNYFLGQAQMRLEIQDRLEPFIPDEITQINFANVASADFDELDLMVRDLKETIEKKGSFLKHIYQLPEGFFDGFEGPLPDEFGLLKNIRELNLSDTRITQLPQSLGNLKELRILNLSNSSIKSLPDSITRLPNLYSLELSNTPICKLPTSFHNLTGLRTLSLGNTRIQELPESILLFEKLTTLNISGIPTPLVKELPAKLKKLVTLDISNTQTETLPSSLFELNALEHLNVSDNPLTELSDSITELRGLRKLIIAGTQIKKLPVLASETFGKNAEGLMKLEHLDISHTPIEELPESVSELSNLLHLNVSNTPIKEIPDLTYSRVQSFKMFNGEMDYRGGIKKLQHLDISYTQIPSLPDFQHDLKKLEALNIEGTSINKLNNSFFYSRRFKRLNISETPIQTLPSLLRNIVIIDIANSQIKEITDLDSIKEITISKDQEKLIPSSFKDREVKIIVKEDKKSTYLKWLES